MKTNERAGIVFKQPKALKDRVDIAHQMCTKLKISLPCLVDKIDNKVGTAYAGWPDRLYVIGKDGKIVYKGGPGPRGFKPADADAAMAKYLAKLR